MRWHKWLPDEDVLKWFSVNTETTDFVGVARKIKEMAKNMDQEKINRLTSNQGIN